MKNLKLLLALSFLFLLSCQVEPIETQEDTNGNLTIEQNVSGDPFTFGPTNPSASCPPVDEFLENRLHWAAYISGLAMFGDGSVISELQTELNLNQTTKALKLTDLLGSSTNTPAFKARFEYFATKIMNGTTSNPPGLGGCPDTPDGGPDDPTGGDLCGNCDQYQKFMDDILVDNCIELYFPRGVYSDWSVDINTAAHPLCNAYGNEGFSRVSCATTIELGLILPNYVQTHEETFIIARPYEDLTNSNCSYPEYSGLDLTFFLTGNWPLAQ